MSWDPLQREILGALGHVVYAVEMPGQGAGAEAPAPTGASPPASARGARAGTQVQSQPPKNVSASDALLRALARAAGLDPDDAAAQALCVGLLPAGGLRDAAARRALWPRLRHLRAGGPR